METLKNNFVKSPLNYTGGKFKLLPQLIPLFPTKINTFVDLFGGGFNVGANIIANTIIYNDTNKQVGEILQMFCSEDTNKLILDIENIISNYNLSKTNQVGFMELRNYYNINKSPLLLYVLVCYAFNNQIRFNSKDEYNMPFGKDRSSFNPTLKAKLIDFCKCIKNKKIKFATNNFANLKVELLSKNDFVYCDVPYLNSISTYNEQNGWNEQNEIKLLSLLDKLNESGVKFGLSNNLSYNNKHLESFMVKYKVNYLQHSYNNCSYHKKQKENNNNKEVYICNY